MPVIAPMFSVRYGCSQSMQNFWNTVSKYPVFVFGTILGVFLNAVKPLAPLFRQPTTAIALIGMTLASLAFVGFTLRAMLGLNPV